MDHFEENLLIGLLVAAFKLKGMLPFIPEIISKVMVKVETVENVGVRFDWNDKVIGEILKARDHHKLVNTAIL